MGSLAIGAIARQAEVSIDTIRYYERAGLIPAPARRASGYREYGPDAVERLRFIRRAKDLGFTLGEVSELLSLSARAQDGTGDMGEMRSAAQARLAAVQSRIAELQRIRDGLQQLVDACPGHGALAACPILAALQDRP